MRSVPPNIPSLLRGVSRSFGLSIRLLPAHLQAPVGLAYLLARITDTVTDTAQAPVAQRQVLLERLQHAFDPLAEDPRVGHALRDFARLVPDPHEHTLLLQGQACLDALRAMPATDRQVIVQVLQAITDGQRWDLGALDGPAAGVSTRAALDLYTWQVAGSVGEFWTRICELHLSDWHRARLSDLMAWGASYGKGLQRLNILRDAGRDLRAGRCYWPAEELQPLGLDREQLCAAVQAGDLARLERLRPLMQDWWRITETQLHDGLRYSLALHGRRLRLASALPCLIGIHTLALLRKAGPSALLEHIKLPRREVRRLLLPLVISGVSDRQLLACWHSAQPAGEGLPLSGTIWP